MIEGKSALLALWLAVHLLRAAVCALDLWRAKGVHRPSSPDGPERGAPARGHDIAVAASAPRAARSGQRFGLAALGGLAALPLLAAVTWDPDMALGLWRSIAFLTVGLLAAALPRMPFRVAGLPWAPVLTALLGLGVISAILMAQFGSLFDLAPLGRLCRSSSSHDGRAAYR
jgi:hypothetical protein